MFHTTHEPCCMGLPHLRHRWANYLELSDRTDRSLYMLLACRRCGRTYASGTLGMLSSNIS